MSSYGVLAERLGFAGSSRLYAILENLMTPDQARIAESLPGTAAEAATATGLDEQQVSESLDELFFKGVVFPKGDFNNREMYRFARSIGQFHDATQATKQRDIDDDEEFYGLWHDFCENEFYPFVGKNQAALTTPPFRVVPLYKAFKDFSEVMPSENYRELLKTQDKIAVVPCACRYRTSSVDEHCEHTSEEDRWNCLQFGRAAEYVIARDSGKELTIDEALELLDEMEDEALVHLWPNSTVTQGVHTSCSCCSDCCMNFVPMDMIDEPIGKVWERSRFEARIDLTKCEGCQKCVERCHFDAIDLVKVVPPPKDKSKPYKAVVDPEKCWGCGACVPVCKEYDAVDFYAVRDKDFIPVSD